MHEGFEDLESVVCKQTVILEGSGGGHRRHGRDVVYLTARYVCNDDNDLRDTLYNDWICIP